MDSIDRNILVALQHDGAAGLAELAKVAGLSVSATAERVKRLEERGTIRGWRADLDPAAVGCPLLAWVFVASVLRLRKPGRQTKTCSCENTSAPCHRRKWLKRLDAIRRLCHVASISWA